MKFNWTEGVSATSYGTGPFHPAIRNGRVVYYWPNITYSTEDEAYEHAAIALADALQPVIDRVAEWNIYPTSSI